MIEFPQRYRSLPPTICSSRCKFLPRLWDNRFTLFPPSLLALFRRRADHRRDIGRRRPVVTRVFLLGVLDPGRIGLLIHDAHRDRHEGVVLAAQFRALSVIHALARRLEPGL